MNHSHQATLMLLQTAPKNQHTSWYSSFLFLILAASSASLDTDVPGMSSNQMVSVSVSVRLTTLSRSSSVNVSFTSSRLCRISTDIRSVMFIWEFFEFNNIFMYYTLKVLKCTSTINQLWLKMHHSTFMILILKIVQFNHLNG